MMNPSKPAVDRLQQIDRAKYIQKSLGARTAASYLRKRGWSIDAALYILCRR